MFSSLSIRDVKSLKVRTLVVQVKKKSDFEEVEHLLSSLVSLDA